MHGHVALAFILDVGEEYPKFEQNGTPEAQYSSNIYGVDASLQQDLKPHPALLDLISVSTLSPLRFSLSIYVGVADRITDLAQDLPNAAGVY